MLKGVFLCFAVCQVLSAAEPVAKSTLFSTAAEESFSTYQMPGDGDLWPSCWADDGNLYAANGDGSAFTHSALRFDMAVSRISGMPPQLSGVTLATNIGTNWSGHEYNRKPTGMLCVGGSLYLAFQNLNLKNFSDAPAASIARSDDHGRTWKWNQAEPMFGTPADSKSPLACKFTTIFFLDFGQDSAHAPASYVYAYGLDNNWREQSALFLARVPNSSIQSRSTWQFFTGLDPNGKPGWSEDIAKKAPVLVDERRLYPDVPDKQGCAGNQAVISQGGVVYDAPLRRYLFASWSCATHQLYEAPEPWGPWKLFLSKDFGRRTTPENRGQYGTNIPSKFISRDGRTFYLQSNICCGGNSYTFALRKIFVEPFRPSQPSNQLAPDNLAADGEGVRAISKSARHGTLCGVGCFDVLNSGNTNSTEDDDDGENKHEDWWGFVWPKAYHLNKFIYQTGVVTQNGGWFGGHLRVQVRQNLKWIDVKGLRASPVYVFDSSLPSHRVTTFRFDETWGDGVRVIGTPGGNAHFTSVGQMAAYYDVLNLLDNGGFEFQTGPNLGGVWHGEGPAPKGITRFEQRGHSGVNNAWLTNYASEWNAIVQTVTVQPQTNYLLTAWIRADLAGKSGRIGIRAPNATSPMQEINFGKAAQYTEITLPFNSGETSNLDVYIGFAGENQTRSLEIDDVSLLKNDEHRDQERNNLPSFISERIIHPRINLSER